MAFWAYAAAGAPALRAIFNGNTRHQPVEPLWQSPYNARARFEDKTRVANG
jgi:hypothetical protein